MLTMELTVCFLTFFASKLIWRVIDSKTSLLRAYTIAAPKKKAEHL